MFLVACSSGSEKPQQVHFVRHARTMFNELGRVQGWSDAPLTDAAVEETQAVAQKMKDNGFEIDLIITSDLKRAVDTANIFKEVYGDVEVITTPLFREVNYGHYEGLPQEVMLGGVIQALGYTDPNAFMSESEHFLRDVTEGMKDSNEDASSENYDMVVSRMEEGMKIIQEDYTKYDNVLIVGHGMSISILAEVIGGEYVNDEIPNLSLTTYVEDENGFKLSEFGSDKYLNE